MSEQLKELQEELLHQYNNSNSKRLCEFAHNVYEIVYNIELSKELLCEDIDKSLDN